VGVILTPSGRLSLASGQPVTVADVASASAVYLTPCLGNEMQLWGGSSWSAVSFSEVALALVAAHQANKNYTVFAFDDSGTFRIGTGPVWTSDSSAGSGSGTSELELLHGVAVNKYAITIRNGSDTYTVPAQQARSVGGFRTIAAGITCDTYANRYLSNLHNQTQRAMKRYMPVSTTWIYSDSAWRRMKNESTYAVRMFFVCDGNPTSARVRSALVTNVSVAANAYVGIGVNSTTVNSAVGGFASLVNGTAGVSLEGTFEGFVGAGHTELNALEKGAGSYQQTWLSNVGADDVQSGISGWVWN
jgi:hypothetical protein